MPLTDKRKAPPLKWFRIYDFTGGQNDWASDHNIKPNETPDSMNCDIREDGFIQKRKGKTAYGGATSGATGQSISGLLRATTSASTSAQNERVTDNKATQLTKKFIRLSDGEKVYYGDDSDGSFTGISVVDQVAGTGIVQVTPFTSRFVQWQNNRFYFTRAYKGVSSSNIWTATYMGRWGLNTAATSTRYVYAARLDNAQDGNAVTGATGDAAVGETTAGDIDVAVTSLIGPGTGYGGTWGESIISARDTWTMPNGNTKYKVTGVEPLDATSSNRSTDRYDVTEWNIYATDGGDTGGTLYYVGNVSAHTGAGGMEFQWVDADYDYSKTAPSASTTGTIANNPVFIHAHNNRMWAMVVDDEDRIWYSNLNKPDEWPASNHFSLSSACTGLISFRGELVIFTANRIYVMRGWSPEDFAATLEIVVDGIGCRAPDSVQIIKTPQGLMVFFVSEHGVYGFDGQTVYHVGHKLGGTFDHLSTSNVEGMRAISHDDRYLLAYTDNREDSTYNNRVLVYDGIRNSWFPWNDLHIGAWGIWDAASDHGEIFCGTSHTGLLPPGSEPGMIYELEQSSETCDFRYKTPYYAPEGPETTIQVMKFRIEATIDTMPLAVTFFVDGQRLQKTLDIPEYQSGPAYQAGTLRDGGKWQRSGTDTYSYRTTVPFDVVGRRIAVQLHHYDSRSKKIVGCSFAYRIRPGRD